MEQTSGPPPAPQTTPTLRDGSINLRPPTAADLSGLLEFFAEPSIEKWWFPHDEAKVTEMIARSVTPGELTGDEEHFGGWIVESDGRFAGWIQAWEDLDPEYPAGSIDIAIAAEFRGQGVATSALQRTMRYLIEDRGHHRVTIDPETANTRAVAAYRKVGFREVGVMRHYCRRAGGELSDGLLMEHVVGID